MADDPVIVDGIHVIPCMCSKLLCRHCRAVFNPCGRDHCPHCGLQVAPLLNETKPTKAPPTNG